jgi:hypothetical protein
MRCRIIYSPWRLFMVLFLLAIPANIKAADDSPKIYVILWFDTEDYLLPASDDAALRVADFLTHEKIRATFKVVGEKARTLERRGRVDVIEALKQHEIGYHSNFHSVQPSPAMYLSDLGWDEGVAEFDRRERPGYDDVTRIFGSSPSCYGQPGSSWAPQSYGAIKKWGMEVYLDAGSHVQLDDRPCYYCGVLNLYKLAHQVRTGLGGPNDLEPAQQRFLSARNKLLAEGGGVVSIFYHPCEFVHQQFWDGVNFRNGANPPREEWRPPPAKTAEESKVAYQTFEQYIRFMKRFADVQFITATEAAKLYRDKARGHRFTTTDLKTIAARVTDRISFQADKDYALAPSEVLLLLNDYVAQKSAGRDPDLLVLENTPYGPSHAFAGPTELVTTDASQFSRTVMDAAGFIRRQGRVPTSVWLGSVPVSPETYLRALADVTIALVDGKPMPKIIELKTAKFAAARYVADDSPNLWGWVIFSQGFRAPTMMELAKRQAWTLKPALLDHFSKLSK